MMLIRTLQTLQRLSPRVLRLLPGLAVLVMSGCSSVESKPLAEDTYQIVRFYSEPPHDLDSISIENKASELCPLGYLVLSKNANKAGEFGYNGFSCAANQNCDYVLEWRVRCEDRAMPEFSIFGKT
ncbi:MAG: hypothetical protein ACP5D0_05320 [Hydrogenovibrio sp.]